MPNDSLLVKKAVAERQLLGKSFFDKKKKDLAEIDKALKEDFTGGENRKTLQGHRDTVANRGYSKEEIKARARLAAMKSKK